MLRRLSVLVVLLSLFSCPFVATAKPTEREVLIDTFARVSNSVGALYSLGTDGDMTFLCSATAIDRKHGKTVVLTANHCVRKGVAYLINFGDNNFRSLRVWKVPHYEVDPEDSPRKYNEPATDIALFLMEGQTVPLVPLAVSEEQSEPGSKVAMVGFPLGIAKIRYEGIISGYLDRPGSDEFGYLLLQIFGAPGSSGSAVIKADIGQIIGVLVATSGSGGLPVIYATPTSYMKNLEIVPGGPGADPEETDK